MWSTNAHVPSNVPAPQPSPAALPHLFSSSPWCSCSPNNVSCIVVLVSLCLANFFKHTGTEFQTRQDAGTEIGTILVKPGYMVNLLVSGSHVTRNYVPKASVYQPTEKISRMEKPFYFDLIVQEYYITLSGSFQPQSWILCQWVKTVFSSDLHIKKLIPLFDSHINGTRQYSVCDLHYAKVCACKKI